MTCFVFLLSFFWTTSADEAVLVYDFQAPVESFLQELKTPVEPVADIRRHWNQLRNHVRKQRNESYRLQKKSLRDIQKKEKSELDPKDKEEKKSLRKTHKSQTKELGKVIKEQKKEFADYMKKKKKFVADRLNEIKAQQKQAALKKKVEVQKQYDEFDEIPKGPGIQLKPGG